MLSVPDHVVLVREPRRRGRRVHDQARVDDGVDLGGPHDPPDQAVLVRDPDELGAVQLAGGVLGIDADDRLHVGIALERLGEPPAPVGRQARDQYAAALGHRPHLARSDPPKRSGAWIGCASVARDNGKTGGVRSKQAIRRSVWTAMEQEGVSRFPGAQRADPELRERARALPSGSHATRPGRRPRRSRPTRTRPQTHSRRLALEEGKILVMAVPRLRDRAPVPAARSRAG